jgi:16S rRNA (uracil1498-N3)-methyltransferase
MPRFFISQSLPPEVAEYEIQGEDARHISTVLRMAAGDPLTLCDGQRLDYSCRIQSISKAGVQVQILGRSPSQTESPLEIRIFQGLPKSDKIDEIIQKSVELGAARITPVSCERCVARVEPRGADRKVERWKKIAEAAAKQSGRGQLPTVDWPVTFKVALADACTADLALMAWEGERDQSLKAVLTAEAERLQALAAEGRRPTVAVLVGPEGGFAPNEVARASQAGLHLVTIGRRILRTETAAPAVLAMLGYQFDDF